MNAKPRAIFTNDAECDDMNSFVHLLLYANDIDIEGLVLSSSVFHYAGDKSAGLEPYRWAGDAWMWEYLDAYEKVYPNLRVHDGAYPTPEYLRSVTCVGNVASVGCMDEDTDASMLIRERILADDPRPLWLLAGGGTNTIAAALRSLEDEWRDTPDWDELYRSVCAKARIYMIITQDDSYRDYIVKSWPDLPLLHCTSLAGVGFLYDEKTCTPEQLHMFRGDWMWPNILSKGALMAKYHSWGDGHVYPGEEEQNQFGSNLELMAGKWWGKVAHERYDMISEGDSPSFLHLVDKGLRQLENPSFGGWGGRFERRTDNEFDPRAAYWTNAKDEAPAPIESTAYQFTRWAPDWLRDFAARASWCVTDNFADANHAPRLSVREGLDFVATPGETLELHAEGSDPDGDELAYSWFRYADADSCEASVSLEASGAVCRLRVPDQARRGDSIHLVCRVTDGGAGDKSLALAAYARVIVSVR
ncbi:MAG: DUF1593 domain-containing protein [Coriobacteriales bacterium]|nr:DUF1593 domain-containing protein [Coriobacteriales bacterium]